MDVAPVNPQHVIAINAIAALEAPTSDAHKQRLRSTLISTLTSAGLDMTGLGQTATLPRTTYAEHTLVVWYDTTDDSLQLFAPTPKVLDATTAHALGLLNGMVHLDLRQLPIEDLDAVVRVLALTSGATDAADLHARLVAPSLRRYDDGRGAPTVADLEALWGQWTRYYVGGTPHPAGTIEAWIARAYAFGTGALPAPGTRRATPAGKRPARVKAKASPAAKAKASPAAKAKAKAKASPAAKAKPRPAASGTPASTAKRRA